MAALIIVSSKTRTSVPLRVSVTAKFELGGWLAAGPQTCKLFPLAIGLLQFSQTVHGLVNLMFDPARAPVELFQLLPHIFRRCLTKHASPGWTEPPTAQPLRRTIIIPPFRIRFRLEDRPGRCRQANDPVALAPFGLGLMQDGVKHRNHPS